MEELKKMSMSSDGDIQTLWDFYEQRWRPFGQMLVDMERWGVKVDTQYLASLEPVANSDSEKEREKFLEWATTKFEDASLMNPSSDKQMQIFLFGGYTHNGVEVIPREKIFKVC